MGFSQTLRDALADVHRRSERWDYLDALLGGTLPMAAFVEFTAQRYFLYSAFEDDDSAVRADPVAGRFVFDELSRLAVVRTDLEHFHGRHWEKVIEPLPAVAEHCARVRELARDWPGGYVAQYYVRYLGDLLGGQVFREKMAKHHGLTGPGIRFYDFAGIPDVPAFRTRYHDLLDAVPWDEDEQARVVGEAIEAFDATHRFFVALADRTMQPR
ncbi:heme oxygenase (biliverdin-producing) [Lentzea sp. JNUCC 0626]|uniref:biliverdin-producing heme oxygenase n=1 Tax=Lentzea sp. JNUCC 0626 TaxID=3367513 RepID=UPI0037494949